MNLLLIDKYLIWSFFKKIFSVLFVFIIIFLIVDLIEDVDRMLDYNLTFNQFSFIYYYSIPHYMNIAFPMAILIATVMTFTLMQKNNEITALKASGVSIYRLTIPFFIIGIILTILMFYFENIVVTKSNTLKSNLEKKYYNKNQKNNINKNVILQIDKNKTIIIDKFNFRNKSANNVSIQEFENNTLKSRLDTENLIWLNNNWVAKNSTYRSFDDKSLFRSFSDTILHLNIKPMDLIESTVKPEEMDYWRLKAFIDRLKSNGREHTKWLVDLYFKTAFPFSNIIMILFGVVLTIRKPRTNFLIGLGLSIFVIFIYYIMIKAGQSAGYSGAVPPLLSVWIANILFFICGLILLTKTKS